MKKVIIASLVVLTLAVASVRDAEATSFTLKSYSVDIMGGWGLDLWVQDLLGSGTSFDLLQPGDSYQTSLFNLRTNDASVDMDGLVPRVISVAVNFSEPLPGFSGTSYGITGAIQLLGGIGYVLWANPVTLSFGSGLLEMSLSSGNFSTPGYTTIDAKFKLIQSSSASTSTRSVPEPATLLLLGVGACSVAGAHLRKRRRASR